MADIDKIKVYDNVYNIKDSTARGVAEQASASATEALTIAEEWAMPTISVGTTTTGDAGTSASVTNSGTSSAAVFNFTIPKGEKGDTGATGATGKDGADGKNGKILYGTCSTSYSTAAKVVSTDDDFTLEAGVTIAVLFSNYNSASSPTLNVNNTGAKTIYAYGTSAPGTYSWRANEVIIFTYDGSYWRMANTGLADTNYYGVTKLSSSTSSTSTTLAASASAVATTYTLANEAETDAQTALTTLTWQSI